VGRPAALGPLVSAAEMAETEVSPDGARGLIAEGASLIDVRNADEHEAGHIDGDQPIPFDRLKAEAGSIPQGAPVVLYCRSGDRSAAAVQALRASGYDAYSIEGGILAWQEQGLPIDGEVVERNVLPPD
jgi:rhodanese-related sulfurtransferase